MIPGSNSRSVTAAALPVWAQHPDPQSILASAGPSKDEGLEYGCVDWYMYRPDAQMDSSSESSTPAPRAPGRRTS